MTQPDRKVTQFPSADPPKPATSGSDGGGNGINSRLAAIEARLAGLEAHLQHMATREDIQRLRTEIAEAQNNTLKWQNSMLKWLIGVMATAGITLVAAVIRMFF